MLFLAVLTFALAVFLVGEAATEPQRRRSAALERAASYGAAKRRDETELPRFRERVVEPAVARLASLALRLTPKTSVEAVGAKLLAAGLGGRISASSFLAVKGALAIGGAVVAVAVAAAVVPVAGILLAPVLGAAGFALPDFVLSHRIKARRERIRSELPDALDVLAVSVEAGLGLDGAIAKLTEQMEGALVDEFERTLGEIRIGEGRQEALRKLAERVPAPELAAFVRSVLQADQLGISLGRVLRVQAADSRLRRQAAAEERAMKAPIKMLFPTALFIFPAMFVVILGPALLNFSHYMGGK
ncbi:MAG TPA: type II secretion system F family protein [Gaiellaceae bacterium]|nr:type II secretion system F family protein [Gaiellaceae bacterium]